MKKLGSMLLTLIMLFTALSIPALAEEPYEFSVMTNFTGEINEASQAWIDKIEATLNIKLNFVSPAASAYDESLQIMVASGEYVDLVLFMSASNNTYLEGVRNGLFISVNDLLPNYPNLLAYTNEAAFEELKVMKDEQIYGVPRCTVVRADGYGIRADWLKNLGIEIDPSGVVTTDELYDILYAFTYKDPDGNGINDTYGFTQYGDIGAIFTWAFGLVGWQNYDGEYMDLMYSKTADNYKRCLAFCQKLWADGLLDPDWPTIDSTVMKERIQTGVTGMGQLFAGNMTNDLVKGQALNPNFDLGYVIGVVEKAEDRENYVGSSLSTGSWGLWAISSTAERPEKIMEFLDYMVSDAGWQETANGVEGNTWNMVDGEMVPTETYTAARTKLISRSFARRNNDASFFVSLDMDSELRTATIDRIQACVDNVVLSLDMGYQPEITNDPIFIDYQKYMKTEIAKIITGARAVDDWDEILNGWYEAGGDQYVAEMQAHIAETQEK